MKENRSVIGSVILSLLLLLCVTVILFAAFYSVRQTNGDATVPNPAGIGLPAAGINAGCTAEELAAALNKSIRQNALEGLVRAEVGDDGTVEMVGFSLATVGLSYADYVNHAAPADVDSLQEAMDAETAVCRKIIGIVCREFGYDGAVRVCFEFADGYKLTAEEVES